VRPGLATTAGPLFLISSPYARKGELWRLFDRHYGANGDKAILVARGTSRTFNPTLPQSVVDRAIERDPASAAAEYMAQFRTDIESFVSIEAVRACIAPGVFERKPERGVDYRGFVDPSGGSADSFTLAVAHNDIARQTVVIDCVREIKPPFSPEAATEQLAAVLASYGIAKVTSDRYAGAWVTEQFGRFNVLAEQSAEPKSVLYQTLLPLINSARIELLDQPRLVNQLCGLERRTARSGRDSIDHAPGGHDDVANAVAGVAAELNRFGSYDQSYAWVSGAETDPDRDRDGARAWRAARLSAYLHSFGRVVL
jgi:hypothetical protein